jgi:hypothetical protein
MYVTGRDVNRAEQVLRHVGAQALEALPGLDWTIERHAKFVRLRLTGSERSVTVRFANDVESGHLSMELVSPDGLRVVHVRRLLQHLEDLTHLRARVTLQQSFQLGDALRMYFDLLAPDMT